MRARTARGSLWLGLVALLVLAARWLAYELAAPSPLAGRLQGSAGGAPLLTVTLVSIGLGLGVATAAVWLASLGVRERHRLRPERVAPSLRIRRVAWNALVLYVSSSLAFAFFESYLHWRAGIGFHGLSCLVGPVHRNAIPLLAALAVAAAGLVEAAAHLYAWTKAAVRELLRPRLAPFAASTLALRSPTGILPAAAPRRPRPRAPPQPA
jgi:hypothetical protein